MKKNSEFMAKKKDSKTSKDDWCVDWEAFKHFTNNVDWYVNFVEDKSQFDSIVLISREEDKDTNTTRTNFLNSYCYNTKAIDISTYNYNRN